MTHTEFTELLMTREALKDRSAATWSAYRRGIQALGAKVMEYENEIYKLNSEIERAASEIASRAFSRMEFNPFDTNGDEVLALSA